MSESFFGDPGWDGNLEEPEAPVAVAEPVVVEDRVVEEPVAETPAETEPVAEEQPRGEDGRFVPKKLEVDDPAVIALLDKYQGDPVKALKAAAEAQALLGRQASEIGELRAGQARIEQRLETPQVAPTQITQDMIDQNPGAATQLAFEQGNTVALQIAFEQWKQDEPFEASDWVNERRADAREQAFRAELDAVKAQFGPAAEAQENQAFQQVVRETVAADPDALERIKNGAETISPEVAETLYAALENGTPTQKIGAFKALAELTRGRENPVTLDVRALAREQALAADEAIAEAGVVSANSARSEPAGKTMADQIGAEWDLIEKPLADGWNIG